MKIALCTLCEGHHHHGVAVLVNSLVAAGCEGTVALDPPFSLEIFGTHDTRADAVAYLDPDLVARCGWAAIEGWFTDDGSALVEDVQASLPRGRGQAVAGPSLPQRNFAAAPLVPLPALELARRRLWMNLAMV